MTAFAMRGPYNICNGIISNLSIIITWKIYSFSVPGWVLRVFISLGYSYKVIDGKMMH